MTKDYLKRITNYIFDKRYTRALLIDGVWGCGKSFFVKNTLIPEIEKTKINNKMTTTEVENLEIDNEEKYKTLLISLYGISSVENIQSAIYNTCLEKVTERIGGEKLGPFFKNAVLFGANLLKGVGSFFGVGEEANNTINQIGTGVLSPNKENTVLLFDDIERCHIDIIELMGFINNLCENNGYRVIIIANENEIAKTENEIASAIQTQTALMDIYGKKFITPQNNSTSQNSQIKKIAEQNGNRENDDVLKKELINHREKIFEHNSLYERTREKLIGLTIRFESRLVEVYDNILNNTISEGKTKEYLLSKKELIVTEYEKYSHENLRTVISLFIAVESVMSELIESDNKDLVAMSKEDIKNINLDSIIDEEKEILLINLIRTSISKAEGKYVTKLEKSKRYGYVNNGIFGVETPYFRYAFVDKYWESLVADREIIKYDFCKRIKERITSELERIHNEEHYELSLFKLQEWYCLPDEEVLDYLAKLKKELKEKKYYPREFKDIVQILICINNEDYGMFLNDYSLENNSTNNYYDPTDDDISILDDAERSDLDSNSSDSIDDEELTYIKWETVNITEYIELMLKYTEEENFVLTKDMLSFYTENLIYARKYKTYIYPLIEWVNKNELSKLMNTEEGDIFDTDIRDLEGLLRKRRDSYLQKECFLSLYGHERIEQKINNSSADEIMDMANAFQVVYNGGFNSFLSADYETINKIWYDLKNDREKGRNLFNPQKSRTREIALRRLEKDFDNYRKQLRKQSDTIAE